MRSHAVAVTRPASDGDRLVAALARRGLRPALFPLLEILGPDDPVAAMATIGPAEGYDLVAFTSRNAVLGLDALLSRPAIIGALAGFLRGRLVVAVGEGTASALRERGVLVDVIPSRGDAAALAAAISTGRSIAGCSVLFPCGEPSRPTLPDQLCERGARVTRAVVYRTVDGDPSIAEGLERALLDGDISVVTFGSGSAVHAFARALGAARARDALRRARVACLGASASAALRSLGVVEDAIAESSSFGALADAVARLLA